MEQGTVKDFNDRTRSGSVLGDDRAEIAIDERSLDGSDLLTLRIGQRVKFEVEERDGGRVARSVRVVTFD